MSKRIDAQVVKYQTGNKGFEIIGSGYPLRDVMRPGENVKIESETRAAVAAERKPSSMLLARIKELNAENAALRAQCEALSRVYEDNEKGVWTYIDKIKELESNVTELSVALKEACLQHISGNGTKPPANWIKSLKKVSNEITVH